ncbi:uncharacterized protein LOC114544393 [Dendronephthya gigantea]|uniref:uncharacterized protein LOC114544393 n=1 Tax=Dendronephthya gigantea TaxID=151771 RepID=UPI001069F905|nr:uncharacterized protein LOC114544393 [Dendronephthya gigantea]
MLHHFKIISTEREQLSNSSHSDSYNNESSVNDIEAEDRESHHNIEDIPRIQNIEPQPVNTLNEMQSDWDDIEGESSMTYYSFSEIRDNNSNNNVNETSLNDPQQTMSTKNSTKDGYSDLGIHRIEKLKCTRDILSEMKKHSKPHIFQ